ncbi:hypothetical protein L596_024803 [Steinernema carpocapsae]|uniref:Uncharacterized protein n=1 Tax=Steinernema carpocapsae TaxID=34508 RepID=A0A4U5M6Q7_STECR|nr:hypothetical protein L596_024803 [Steinernema carpocapsae]
MFTTFSPIAKTSVCCDIGVTSFVFLYGRVKKGKFGNLFFDGFRGALFLALFWALAILMQEGHIAKLMELDSVMSFNG